MPTILLVAELAFGARILLQSKVLDHLKAGGARVVVLTPDAEAVRSELKSRGHDDVAVEPFDPAAFASHGRPFADRFFSRCRLFAVKSRTNDDMYVMEREDARRTGAWKGRTVVAAAHAIAMGMRANGALARAVVDAENRLVRTSVLGDVLARHEPDLVVCTSPGTFASDRFVIREAKARGHRVAVFVLSWDNTTVRGLGVGLEDDVIAWSPVMRDELVRLHRVPAERVRVGGVPHYDPYARGEVATPSDLATAPGVDPRRPFALVGTKSPNTYRCNPDVARILLDASERGDLPRDLQVVARLHPLYHRPAKGSAGGNGTRGSRGTFFDEERPEWDALAEAFPDRMILDVPEILPSRLGFLMPVSEIAKLGGLVKHAAVVVNMFSTLNIEAAIFDTPTVNVAFDLPEKRPKGGKVERFDIRYDEVQDHNVRLTSTGGTRIARSPADLVREVRAYLAEPSRDAEGRRRIVARECGDLLGRSSETVAAQLLDAAKRGGRS